MLHALAMSIFVAIPTRGKMSIQKIIKLVFRLNDIIIIIIITIITRQAPVTRSPPTTETPISRLLLGYIEIYPYKTYTSTLNQNGSIY